MRAVILTITVLIFSIAVFCAPQREVPMERQNPSPLVESSREHARIDKIVLPGKHLELGDLFDIPFALYIPTATDSTGSGALLIHFHGAPYIIEQAASGYRPPVIVATVNLGSGSSAYERPFQDPEMIVRLISTIKKRLAEVRHPIDIERIYLSSFSAGYGAVRAILRYDSDIELIDGILLLDGIHTDYVPVRTPLSKGGILNAGKLEPLLRFAKLAQAGKKKFVLTHSEIFPGTYASTTECADFLLQAIGLKRKPVLKWGPVGMQQTSETFSNGFMVLGFAGNSAPDHMDHLHGMSSFLKYLLEAK